MVYTDALLGEPANDALRINTMKEKNELVFDIVVPGGYCVKTAFPNGTENALHHIHTSEY